jgi:NADH-quinone oxidoreductase subunit H
MLLLEFWAFTFEKLVLIGGIISVSLIAMYSTYAERKVAAVMQDRRSQSRGSIWHPATTGRRIEIVFQGRNYSKYFKQILILYFPFGHAPAMMTCAVIPWGGHVELAGK